MSAVSIGKLDLLGSVTITAQCDDRFWRRTFEVNDPLAQVGRRWGNGSPSNGKAILSAIMETAKDWFNEVNDEATAAYKTALAAFNRNPLPDAEVPEKPRKLYWNILATLAGALSFVDFKTGNIIATYDMIAKASRCCIRTAKEHMAILRDLGFIDWVRRCKATGDTSGPRYERAPNQYFFEISRLPEAAQATMRNILDRRGVELKENPELRGSGPVPNKAQRLIERVAKGLSKGADLMRNRKHRDAKMAEAAFVRSEITLMQGVPDDQWACIRHPNDSAAQEAYRARLGIPSFIIEGAENGLHSPLTD